MKREYTFRSLYLWAAGMGVLIALPLIGMGWLYVGGILGVAGGLLMIYDCTIGKNAPPRR